MSSSHPSRRTTHEDIRGRAATTRNARGELIYEEENGDLSDQTDSGSNLSQDDLSTGSYDSNDLDAIEDGLEADSMLPIPNQGRNATQQGARPNGSQAAPFSPGASRKVKGKENVEREPRMEPRIRVPARTAVNEERQRNGGLAFLAGAVIVGLIIMLGIGSFLRAPNVSAQCTNGFSEPLDNLKRELNSLGDIPSTFEADEFIRLFKSRIIGKPTVVHVVSTSNMLPRRLADWVARKQPCAGKLTLEDKLGNFKQIVGTKAAQFDKAQVVPGDCRVVLTVTLENSQFVKDNRDFIESATDDTMPYVHTPADQVPTEDWCILLLDHWTGARADSTETWKDLPSDEIDLQIRNMTANLWTGRFYQRIQGIFYV